MESPTVRVSLTLGFRAWLWRQLPMQYAGGMVQR